jgi:23S rRNA U2552 (ribose-2'-O)-methylase RlmE/FtsJ
MNSTELLELCRTNKYDTDKFSTDNTICTWVDKKHSYVESAYGELFKRFRLTKNILEIGVYTGGSHLLWRDYFPEATVVGIDIKHCDKLDHQSRIIEIVGDAYKNETLNLFKDDYFDIIIDDGPHTLDTMLFCVKNYLSKLSDNGIMCIEDIVEYSWLRQLSDAVPSELQKCIKVFDLRQTDEKNDSILMIIDKGELNG